MSEERFEAWAIVELFGHQRLAGLVTEQTVGGCSFVRVDIPRSGNEYTTRLLGQGAIYAINFTDEQVAREFACRNQAKPVSAYDVPKLAQDLRARRELDFDDND